jgi:hypothetical protein
MLKVGSKFFLALTLSVRRPKILIKFPYFADTTEKGDKRVEERVTSWRTLFVKWLWTFV